jgi:5'-phosphate synthase pdxT subunit
MNVGVVAVQGGFAAHEKVLRALGHTTVQVRNEAALADVDALVLPGGESSAQLRLLDELDMAVPLSRFVDRGAPVLATCAGLILVARRVDGPVQPSLGWIDVDVQRNGYGRQVDSFSARSDDGALPLLFIRAPRITRVGHDTEVLATHGDHAVLVRQSHVIASTFHPELTADLTVHRLAFGDGHRRAREDGQRLASDVLPAVSSAAAAYSSVLSLRR